MRHPFVLLFGMPRSGTTWVGKILDSHPGTAYRHEPDAGGTLNHVPWVIGREHPPSVGDALRGFAAGLLDVNTPKVAASLPVFPKQYRSRAQSAAHYATVWAAKAGEPLRLRTRVLSAVPASRRDDVTMVWKSVESLTRIGGLVRALDARRAIVLLRHPCGQIASGLRGETAGQFDDADRGSDDYGIFELLLETEPARRRGLALDHLRGLHPLQRLAWKWVLTYETALDGIDDVDGCLAVRYEDICDDPMKWALTLLEFCGLPWSEQTAAFVRASTSQHSDAYYSVFKNPAQAASRWRRDLDPEQVEMIFGVLRQSPLAEWYPPVTPADNAQEEAPSWPRQKRPQPVSFNRLPGIWSILS